MPRQPTPMEETDEATALHDREMVGAVPDKPMSPETKLWFREQLKKKGIKFAEPIQPQSEIGSTKEARATQDAPDKTLQPSFAAGSKGLLELKKELQQKGMSDADAEEYLRTL